MLFKKTYNQTGLKKKKYIVIATLFLLKISVAASQTSNFQFEHLSTAEGLSSNEIRNITQDKYGFLWIATSSGLNRYDGKHIVIYKHSYYDSSTIASNAVYSIAIDSNSNIWVCTRMGVSCLNRNGKFQNYFFKDDKGQVVFETNLFSKISITHAGQIIVFSQKLGLLKIDVEHHKIVKLNISIDNKYHVNLADDGTIIFKSKNAFFQSGDGRKNFVKIIDKNELPAGIDFSSIEIGSLSSKYFILLKSNNHFTTTTWLKVDRHTHKILDSIRVPGTILRTLEYPENNFWLASWPGGLWHFDELKNIVRIYGHDRENINAISTNRLQCLFKDRENTFWAGGDNGIDYFSPDKENVQTINNATKGCEKANITDITDIMEDLDGNLWLSMNNYDGNKPFGLLRINPSTFKFQRYLTKGAPYSQIWTVLASDKNNLLLNTQSGLFNFKFKSNFLSKTFLHPYPEKVIKATAGFSVFTKDKEGNYWFGLWRNGLIKYNPHTGRQVYFSAKDSLEIHKLSGNFIAGVAEDAYKRLWVINDENNMLDYIDTNNIVHHQAKLMVNNEDITGTATNILVDYTGEIWIGTRQGLLRYNPINHKTRFYDTSDNLPNATISNLSLDNKRRLWIYTAGGLVYMDTSRMFIAVPDLKISGYKTNFGAQPMLSAGNGNIYFGNSASLYYFNPDNVTNMPGITAPVILSVTKDNNNTQLSPDTKEIELKPGENNIRLNFASVNPLHSNTIRYRYKMENYDDHWIDCGNEGEAIYTKLPPGVYKFIMFAVQPAGDKNAKFNQVSIKVLPIFYQAWWFKLLTGLIITLIVAYLIYYLSTRRLHQRLAEMKRQKQIDVIRNRIAQDIHDDIGSGLTKISIQSELAKQNKENSGEAFLNTLSNINSLSHELIYSLGDIVWTVNPLSDNTENMLAYFRHYINIFFEGLPQQYKINFDALKESINVHPDIKRNLFLILKEALNNAVKHSSATLIDIGFLINEDKYIFSVNDNGSGINAARKTRFSLGLSSMRKRAKQIHAVCQIHAGKEKGTLVEVRGKFYSP